MIEAVGVQLAEARPPFRLAGAWGLKSPDGRLHGVSGLTVDGNQLRAITDLGAVLSLQRPQGAMIAATFTDLREGPGRFGYKISRDAEAFVADGQGGWLVVYEQRHSIWRYDGDFRNGRQFAAIDRTWPRNRGAEAIVLSNGQPIVFAQDGTEVLALTHGRWTSVALETGGWEVSDAATAPGGEVWLLLRRFGRHGFENALAPLLRGTAGYRAGRVTAVPKGWSDNLEGLALTQRPGGLRFWMISDDGHRIFARTLLIALDLPRVQESARR